ncbi:hypothetical protein ABZV93_11110 [Actinopolymorpha sp. NPDC004070]|uniref:hypothetical protein n=1 Tax=Actinopolymorpha sp. NPDC004070 TaxID=3154548 RepID=UPI0033AE69EA
MPVSSTATFTPDPSSPRCQAAGAPICGTLWSRLARTLASSHTRRTPPVRAVAVSGCRVFAGAPVSPDQKRAASCLRTDTAPAWAAPSRAVSRAAGGAAARDETLAVG